VLFGNDMHEGSFNVLRNMNRCTSQDTLQNEKCQRKLVVAQFAVVAPYECRNLLNLKPAVIDRRHNRPNCSTTQGMHPWNACVDFCRGKCYGVIAEISIMTRKPYSLPCG
jgi:hypothetical protein